MVADGILGIVGHLRTICLFTSPTVLYARRSFANDIKLGVAYEFTIDERGIESVAAKPFLGAWRDLTSGRDHDMSLIFMRLRGRPIVIPKRASNDGDVALWRFLEGKLGGSRYLVRGSGMPLTITNTRAREKMAGRHSRTR